MTTAGLARRRPTGLRRLGRALRGPGLSGVSLAGAAAAGAFASRRQTYPRPRQDAAAQRRPAAAAAAPADRIVVAVVLGARGSVGTDALAPYGVFSRSPAFLVYTASAGRAAVVLSGGLVLAPDHPSAHLRLAGRPWPWRPTALFTLTFAAATGAAFLPAAARRRRP